MEQVTLPGEVQDRQEEVVESFKVAFTGHRPNKLFGYSPNAEGNQRIIKWLRSHMERLASKYDHITFISGGALGIDMWVAEIALRIKEQHANVDLHMAIPCKNQDKKWTAKDSARYREILDLADSVHYVSEEQYTHKCMQDRNEYMVDQADAIISVWDGKRSGGTFNCLEYADKKRIPKMIYNHKEDKQYNVKKKDIMFK